MTPSCSYFLVGALLAVGVASPSHAQAVGQNTYGAPSWGQAGSSAWGTQSGTIGQQGWQSSTAPQANQPAGNSAYPNATGRPFGSRSDSDTPLTTRGRRN